MLHGSKSFVLQDEDGQTSPVHSAAAGLDYPGVGPAHSCLKALNRSEYTSVSDAEALSAFKLCCRSEGIVPALESAHAIAYILREGPRMPKNSLLIMCMSGRGDKDVYEVEELLNLQGGG